MRSLLLYSCFLLFIFPHHSYAQCLTNGTFSGACGSVVTASGLCPTWTDACGDGWVRSNGSPQMMPYTVAGENPTGFYAYMYSYKNTSVYGEGMFTPYNFVQGAAYEVKINFTTTGIDVAANYPADGTVVTYAANGLGQSPLTACDQEIPTISQKESIGVYSGLTPGTGQATADYTFIADNNYSQFWIFPYSARYVQYNLNLYRVQICQVCLSTVSLNSGGVLPTYIYAQDIEAGGGTGTETIQPTVATNLVASEEIDFLTGFQATVSTGGSLTASILPCNAGTGIQTTDYFDSLNIVTVNNPNTFDTTTAVARKTLNGTANSLVVADPAAVKLQVYPSVSNGVVNITGSLADLGNTDIVVSDESGRVVYRTHNAADLNIRLDLSNLSNGLYFILISNKAGTSTQKIIINK